MSPIVIKMWRRLTRGLFLITILGFLSLALTASAGADPPSADWSRLRMCEASGSYTVVAANGHYGAYQFDLATWRSVGGSGLPSDAAPAEQDYRALALYRKRGWQPWECAGKLGLQADADAGSGRVPTRPESAYMSGAPAPAPTGNAPAWPGTVFSPGDCDPALRTWQLQMNVYGYGFVGTGCYAEKTRQAVLDLQRANGIKDSGLLGPKTWAAAWGGTSPTPSPGGTSPTPPPGGTSPTPPPGGTSPTPPPAWPGTVFSPGDCDPALRTWQLQMNVYGYGFAGTGCYAEKTRQAVLNLQRANGIKDSGLLGPKTWTAAWDGIAPGPPS